MEHALDVECWPLIPVEDGDACPPRILTDVLVAHVLDELRRWLVARRTGMRVFATVFVLMAVVPAGAHHPFTPFYDASRLVSVTGTVVELRAANPHVVLIVDGMGPAGVSGRWAYEGFPANVFARGGQADFRERLRPGTRITISGWPATDPDARAFSGRDITFADGSTLLFGPTPAEADRWSCGAAPCPYTYPDVTPN